MRDADVRKAVKAQLDALHKGDPTTRVVEEMGIWSGTVRVDIAVINGELNGFELKSDSDTLDRLPNQVEIYGKVFDRMTLVVGGRHYEKALSRIPDWWGCIVATMESGQVSLNTRRKAKRNPSPDPDILVQLLWKNEALAVLDKYGFAEGWRNKRSAEITDRLVNKLSYRRLAASVREALKARAKLGQLSSSNFDMPIDAIADPTSRTSGSGSRIGDSIDHLVAPAM